MIISRNIYELLQSEDLDVRDDYSGRFMYGARCFGITVSNFATAVYQIMEALRRITDNYGNESDTVEEAEKLLDCEEWLHPKTDNLGLDYIVYFPDITVEEEN